MREELPVAAGDVVMVSLDKTAYAGLTAGSVADPGLDVSIVVVVPNVPPYGSTQVVITGIRYGFDNLLLDVFGHTLPYSLLARDIEPLDLFNCLYINTSQKCVVDTETVLSKD